METRSVTATLSAKDANFTKTMEAAQKSANNLKGVLKKGLGFGVMAGLGHKAFSVVTSGIGGMIQELESAGASWKTFDANMAILGKTDKEINRVRKDLQKFAQDTIYSASDMSGTYSQLAAVGIDAADKLVVGFGGIAAAAENPKQAMKTLSQQGVQMAAKPYVAWQDFKLMLEQTPAGIAAVAKEMGMSTSDLVSSVQDGTVATQDFFNAIIAVGNSEDFSNMARQYKSVGEAMDGLKETAANKLGPAFGVLQEIGIKAITSIADKIENINTDEWVAKISGWVEKAKPYWESFKEVAGKVGEVIKKVSTFFLEHSDTIAKVLPYVLSAVAAFKTFNVINSIMPGMGAFTKSLLGLASGGLGGLAGKLFGVSAGTTATGKSAKASNKSILTMAKSSMMLGTAIFMIAGAFALLAYSAIQLADAGGLAIGVMVGMAAAVAGLLIGGMAAMKAFSQTPARAQAGALAMVALGAAVLLVATGLAILAGASIALANAGAPAVACMVGMVATIALLAVGAAALGPALTAGAIGFVAFGAAILLVGAGALLASSALQGVAGVLPTLCEYGLQGTVVIVSLGVALIAFAAGATLAGAGALVLGAGLVVLGAGALVAGAGMAVLGASLVLVGTGAVVAGTALMVVNTALPMIAMSGIMATTAMTVLGAAMLVTSVGALAAGAGVTVLGAGLLVLAAGAIAGGAGMLVFSAGMLAGSASALAMVAALTAVNSKMKSIQSAAKATNTSMKQMTTALSVVEAGLSALGSKVKSVMSNLASTFDNTSSKAIASAKKLGTGYAQAVSDGCNKAKATITSTGASITASVTASGSAVKASVTSICNGVTSALDSSKAKSVSIAKSMSSGIISALSSASSGAYSCGVNIGVGLANGMASQLSRVRSIATQLAAQAEKAIRAKAQIHSPSRVTRKLGGYYSEGWINSIKEGTKKAYKVASELVSVPEVNAPEFALAGYGSGGFTNEYLYTRNDSFNITVVSEIDGREVAKSTAPYTKDEISRIDMKNRRKKGLR